MKLSEIPRLEEFDEDEDDWLCYIEVRKYDDPEDPDAYDGWGDLPVFYVCTDHHDKLFWIKVRENDFSSVFSEDFRYFFINGPLMKGGFDEIEMKPFAIFRSMVYFKPIDE